MILCHGRILITCVLNLLLCANAYNIYFCTFTFRCLSGEKLGGMSLLIRSASKNWSSGLQIMRVHIGKTMTLSLNVRVIVNPPIRV